MIIAPPHPREADRLAELRALRLLDDTREPGLEAMAEAAKAALGLHIGVIGLMDEVNVRVKACFPVAPAHEIPRALAFSAHAILQDGPTVVADARLDERFADNPMVTGEPYIRTYVAVPLRGPGGLPLGTLAAYSVGEAIALPQAAIDAMVALARAAEQMLLSRRRRLLSETRLRQSDTRFDTIIESVPDGVAIYDNTGQLLTANAALFELAGLHKAPDDEGPDQSLTMMRYLATQGALGEPPAGQDVEALVADWRARLAAGLTCRQVARLRDEVMLECILRPIIGPAGIRGGAEPVEEPGAPLGLLLLLREMGPRLAAEEVARALRQENALLRTAIEATTAGIAVTDTAAPNRPLVYVNPAFSRMTGWRAAEAIGRNSSFLIGSETNPAAVERMRTAMQAGDEYRSDLLVYRQDGTPVWIDFHVSPMLDEGGKPRHFMAVMNDISAHRRLVRELESARTVAEDASRAKSDFLASMSHEIRTPLNGIIGMTTLLLATDLDTDQRRFAHGALQSGELLLAVINDVLDIAKLEAGKVELETIPFDLAETIEGAVELVAGQAFDKGLEVAIDIPSALRGQWLGDPTRLAQVMLNLAGNAVKFTDRGHVVVHVALAAEDRLRIEVSDTGPGLAPEAVERLFQKFTQADSSITRRFGGTGLGLAISKHIVELMGGRIGVSSRLGQGATFFVELPMTRVAETTAPALPRLSGRRALVVDDMEVNRTIFLRQLRDLGIQADAAEDAFAASAMVERATARGQPYDLVLVDQMMPILSGVALARRLRHAEDALPANLHATRYVLTSSTGQSLPPEDRTLFEAVLAKPVRHRALVKALSRALADDQGAAVPGVQIPSAPQNGPGGRVLLAEDNPINREIASRMLEGAGFQVTAVPDGNTALTAATSGGFDAILMDVEMPGMDGVETTRRIRALGGLTGAVPVIALTAHAMAGTRERLLSAGMSDYLSKPFRPAELIDKVRGAITLSQASLAPPAAESDELLDAETVEALGGLALEDRQAIFGAFADETPQQMTRLKAACAAGRSEAVRAEAHRMVGGSAACGALHMSSLARQIEDSAARGDLQPVPGLIAALDKVLPATVAGLRAGLGFTD